MAFDKLVFKNLLKNFDSVPFTVEFWDHEIFSVGQGEPKFKVYINGPISKKI